MKAFRLAVAAALALPGGAAAQPPRGVEGTWDLIWQTRHGPQPSGYLVLTRRGAAIDGEIHGQGSVRASGTVTATGFVLRGRRMLVPYTIEGRVRGDRMEGSLKMLSVDRRFTGRRRPG